ncbi:MULTISPECIES: outer membrane beta-barrel protein [unclassified Dysgonomonas]|uniref:outer membrane beta-barrel protein n=1 Tax=unclassified Dysgonomonas TaxID=2630389 RepID=UPI0006810AF9|nr:MULTISPECIES: outer membrane beta-barrel protein [unclassified Dysgonomonas]MBD8346495.1 porin family protein [Dysgonomonas sp. HGC4]MBF0574589.1 porin family protein [Dysgonomonas sp. GY617]
MKKLLLAVAFVASTLGAFAQSEKGEKSLIGNIGYQSNAERFMLGVQGRYVIAENIRLAPDVMFFFPKDKVTGLDINVNVHYVFNVDEKLSVYPLAGIAMQNNRYSGNAGSGGSNGFTDWGFNLGAGAGYELGGNRFANLEIKYTFGDADCMVVALGYGFKF